MPSSYSQKTLDAMSDDERRRRHLKVREPKRNYHPRTNTITLRLDPDTLAQVMVLAKRLKQTRTQTVRDLVEWGLESVRFEDNLSR